MARTSPRYLFASGLVEVTTRALQSRFLLRPSSEVNRTIVAILAKAQARYRVSVHAVVVLSNHIHLLLSPGSQQRLSLFMGFVNSNIARKVGRLHHWREKLWGRRYQAIPVTHQEKAQRERLRYFLEQGCKEGLVSSPREWPGVSSAHALLDGTLRMYGTWTDQTALYRERVRAGFQSRAQGGGKRRRERRRRKVKARDFQTPEVLILTPLPAWEGRSLEWIQAQIVEMVEAIEVETRERHASQGTKALGARAVLRQDPTKKPARTKRSAAPRVHASTREARLEYLEAYKTFLLDYRRAAAALKRGALQVVFPRGCFPPARPYVPYWDTS